MRMRDVLPRLVVAVIACVVVSTAALAHRPAEPQEGGQLEELIQKANLVIVGEVAEVEYVMARTEGDGEDPLPFTIVTYKVDDALRGKPTGETLSLQFIGGTDGRGGFLTVSGVPQFQEGERDLLFIAGNGANETCPLVECEYGRFRLHQNRVYNTHGQPVRGLVGNNPVARGPRAKPFQTFKYPTPGFDDLIQNPEVQANLEELGMSVEEAREQYRTKAPRQVVVTRTAAPPSRLGDRAAPDPQAEGRKPGGRPDVTVGEAPVAVQEFVTKIRELNRKVERRPKPVESVDRGAPIVLRLARPADPGKPGETPEPQQIGRPDQEELEALRRQDFNPVLKKKND